MTAHSFSLIPFPDSNAPRIQITGTISRQDNLLPIRYALSGQTENILFPKQSAHPSRTDELWKATCFELFLAFPNAPHYWEFNMSSSGDWNVYRMDRYRRVGFQEEKAIQQLNFSFQNGSNSIALEATVDLNPLIQTEQSIQVGITSVIQTKDGHETYWALVHPNPQADFHLRESFILSL